MLCSCLVRFVIHVFLFTKRGNPKGADDWLMTTMTEDYRRGFSPRYPFIDFKFTSDFAFKARKARTFKH